MPRVRKSSDGSHLKPSYFKEFKSNHEHDLQDHILKLSPHHLALVDAIVTKANQGKRLDPNFYPDVDLEQFKPLAKQLHGHTHSVISLAKKHREIKGAGWGSLLNFGSKAGKVGLKGLQRAGKIGWAGVQAGAKFAGKAGVKFAEKSGRFLIENPRAAMAIGQTVMMTAQSMMADDEPQQQQQQQQQRRKPKTVQTTALDELLDTSDDEEPTVRQARKKGSGLARSRWVI